MSGQKRKKVVVSRSNLTTCPSCMAHITLASSLEETSCPFCQANLVVERRQDDGVFGRNAMQSLKKSRSAMLAAALGASLSMAACGEKNGNNDTNNNTVQPVYGAPLVDMEQNPDLDNPVPEYGAPMVDMEQNADLDNAVPEYGAPIMEDMAPDQSMTQPLYGAVPYDMEVDAGGKDMDNVVPEYGAPPSDMG